MANMYEGFIAEFRLVDLDGIVLAAPGNHIVINEPEDYDKVMIKLKRSKNHGVDYEFSDPETPFKFDQVVHDDEKGVSDHSPYSFIQALYDAAGVDAKCHFEYRHLGETPEIQYQGRISMKFGINDDLNSMSTRRINLDDLMRTRLDTKVDFTDTVSIDGSAITPLASQDMVLHSKLIIEDQIARADNEEDTAFLTTTVRRHAQIDQVSNELFAKPALPDYTNVLEEKYGREITTALTDSPENELEAHYIFTGVEGALLVDFDYDYSLQLITFGGVAGVTRLGTYIRINEKETLINAGITYPAAGGSTLTADVTFSFQGSFNIPKGARVYIYDKWDIPGINLGLSQFHDVIPRIDHKVELHFHGVTPNTTAPTYKLFESVRHILAVINNANSLLISGYLQNEAEDIRTLNGYILRGHGKTIRPQKMSFDTIFDKFIRPVFGLGFAIVESGGVSKVLMEKYEHFYADKEILTIDSIEEGSWNLFHDKAIHFNESKIGFKEFPKSTDESKSGNLDEFHTEHQILFPLETIKAKKDFISDVITAGHLFESQKREQFKSVPADTVSYDEKIFAVKGINSDTYTGVTCEFLANVVPQYFIDLEGKFFAVEVGDIVTFTGTTSNNASFTILEITQELTGNVNIDVGIRLRVLEPIVIEAGITNASMQLPAVILRSERDEAFDILDGITDPITEYNAGLNIKNMLMNQSPILNSGMNKKPGTAIVKTQEAFLNGLMRSQFKVGEGGYVLDPDRQTIIQNEDLTLSQLNQNQKLHSGLLFSFKARLDYSLEILRIRDANLNQHPEDINYGYIRVLGDDGLFHKGHLLEMDYNPLAEWTTFLCREKFD